MITAGQMEAWEIDVALRQQVIMEQRDRIKKLAEVLSKAKAAVDHHRIGYDLDSASYDENTMIALMEELGEAVDEVLAGADEIAEAVR